MKSTKRQPDSNLRRWSCVARTLARNGRGLTLVELLMAMSATAIVAMGIASLVVTVYASHDYVQSRTTTAQHARVFLGRWTHHLESAHASEAFPGCVVFSETVGTNDFPEVLVIWSPETTAANPTGLPLQKELVLIAPDPNNPSRLLECSRRGNSTTVPALSNVSAWFTLIDTFRETGTDVTRTELTNLLRQGTIDQSGTLQRRGTVRFRVKMTPSETEWASFRAGTKSWSTLNWPLDFRGANFGLRRVTCFVELQLVPPGGSPKEAVPFFGATGLTYSLSRL